jgi:hypothetical protein
MAKEFRLAVNYYRKDFPRDTYVPEGFHLTSDKQSLVRAIGLVRSGMQVSTRNISVHVSLPAEGRSVFVRGVTVRTLTDAVASAVDCLAAGTADPG